MIHAWQILPDDPCEFLWVLASVLAVNLQLILLRVPGISAASPGGSGEYTVLSTVVVESSYISH